MKNSTTTTTNEVPAYAMEMSALALGQEPMQTDATVNNLYSFLETAKVPNPVTDKAGYIKHMRAIDASEKRLETRALFAVCGILAYADPKEARTTIDELYPNGVGGGAAARRQSMIALSQVCGSVPVREGFIAAVRAGYLNDHTHLRALATKFVRDVSLPDGTEIKLVAVDGLTPRKVATFCYLAEQQHIRNNGNKPCTFVETLKGTLAGRGPLELLRETPQDPEVFMLEYDAAIEDAKKSAAAIDAAANAGGTSATTPQGKDGNSGNDRPVLDDTLPAGLPANVSDGNNATTQDDDTVKDATTKEVRAIVLPSPNEAVAAALLAYGVEVNRETTGAMVGLMQAIAAESPDKVVKALHDATRAAKKSLGH